MSKEEQPTNIKVVWALVLYQIFFLDNLSFLLAVKGGERSFPERYFVVYICFHTSVYRRNTTEQKKKSFAERSELQRHKVFWVADNDSETSFLKLQTADPNGNMAVLVFLICFNFYTSHSVNLKNVTPGFLRRC